MKQELQKLIDRAVGKGGNLSLPSWWMNKILNDLIKYCEEGDASSIKNYLNEYVKKEDIATINDKSIINGGNITIEDAESYDDTEIKQQIAELSTEIDTRLNENLYAYPVETLDGKENKVVGLGGDAMYVYVGELVASEFGTPTEEKAIGETACTTYLYQPIYDGKYFDRFEENYQDKYITLYIGNDVDGYSSNKVYISEDANNLTYYDFSFVGGFVPRMLEVAISPNYTVYYRNYWHYANKNSKIFFAPYKQKLDLNLIPQEIARKEDIATEVSKEINNHEYPVVTVDADTKTYSGQLGDKTIKIDINLSEMHLDGNNLLNLVNKSNGFYQYENNNINIVFVGANNVIVDLFLKKPVFAVHEFDLEWTDYKNADFANGNCIVKPIDGWHYPATMDSDDFVTALIHGKYFKYKLNRETHLLELQSEIDLNSIESRLAALESNVNIETTLTTEV